jgi:hypothetical protein
VLPAKALADAIRSLKDLVFARQRSDPNGYRDQADPSG